LRGGNQVLNFAGIDIPSYLRVNKVTYPILPSIESKTEKVAGRAGEYDFGVEIGTRSIKVDVQIIGDDQFDIMKKATDLAQWLFHEDLQPLIISDEPDKQYMARLVNDSEIEELFRVGQATLEFLIPNPYKEATVEKLVEQSVVSVDPFNVVNDGGIDAYPVIDLTMRSDSTSISVITEDKFVMLGQSDSVEKTKVTVNPLVLTDSFTSYTGWTSASNVDGGTVTGGFSSNGSVLSVSDYGEGTTWHGASGIKPLSRAITDFQVDATVGLKSSAVDQIGRVEVYLLDSNNVQIAKIALKDMASEGDFPMFEARAGALSGGKYIVQSYGDKKGVFSQFNGIIRIARNGKKWSAYIAKVDSKGNHTTRLYKEWLDSSGVYTKQLAKVQVHIGASGTRTPVNNMYLADINVRELTDGNVDNATQTPVIFNAGDVVTIDNQRAIVLKNGEPIFSVLDPSSDFFSLKKGINGLIVSPPVANVSIRYKERWL
jgi:predicted phage tail component-like protein